MTIRKAQLLSAHDLNHTEIHDLFQAANCFHPFLNQQQPLSLLKGCTVANLFFEPSTRTRISFEAATRALGGSLINFVASDSSLSKGESLIDTGQNIQAMKPQCFVVRHRSSGACHLLSRFVHLPVINAGDGHHEHPTQGLLDTYTLQKHFGGLNAMKGKKILILGDISHSRVARSNLIFLKTLGAQAIVCGPPTLLPPFLDALETSSVTFPEEALAHVDAVMTLRMQMERHDRMTMQMPSIEEYRQFWCLSEERARLLKKGTPILHPGPINRGVEIAPEVADSKNSLILDQVTHGVLIRMAVLANILRPKELNQWVKENAHG